MTIVPVWSRCWRRRKSRGIERITMIKRWQVGQWRPPMAGEVLGQSVLLSKRFGLELGLKTIGVRGHPSISLLPFSSHNLPLSICIPHPYLCTIYNDHTYSRLTNSCRVPASHSASTLATSDEPQTHRDRSA
jgi:hypothetical protein